ncbi:MAG: indole-3-glycerol phosphate synthase TrpC [Phycisphaeraceae bacterium]|nr:indole-3-glycerol phosphate synthase TrpC [Phycisphaeraceae bacterium]
MSEAGGNSSPTTLDEIVAHKREEVERAKSERSLDDLHAMIDELGRPRNFFAAVTKHDRADHTAIIAEIKRRSPSAGLIRPEYGGDGFDPAVIARAYHGAGASALSCLTDARFFGGDLSFIHRVRDAAPLPVLRKDFIIDPYQVVESRAFGADAILLIAECLTESQLLDLMILAHELQLTALVETHDMDSLLRVRPHVGFPARSYMLLGINNRDLTTMTTDLSHTLRMLDLVDDKRVLVSESGIASHADLVKLRSRGVRIALVGESLMREADPGAALRRLMNGDR